MVEKKSIGWQKKKKESPAWIKKAGKALENVVKGHATGVGMTPKAVAELLAAVERHKDKFGSKVSKKITGTKKDLGKKYGGTVKEKTSKKMGAGWHKKASKTSKKSWNYS